MKTLLCSLLLLTAFSMNAQTDTVMMNKRFETADPNQLYEIKSLRISTSYTIASISMAAASTTFFIVANSLYKKAANAQSDYFEQSCRDGGDACMVLGVAMGIGTIAFNISSIVSLRQPTTIRPVKVL